MRRIGQEQEIVSDDGAQILEAVAGMECLEVHRPVCHAARFGATPALREARPRAVGRRAKGAPQEQIIAAVHPNPPLAASNRVRNERRLEMPAFPGLDAMLVLWGAAVLAYAAAQHLWFGGTRLDAPKRGR